MYWLTECLYCQNFVYILSDNRVKCSKCHKKLSLNKINKIFMLVDLFIEDESALQVSKRLNISYSSVHSYYEKFRKITAQICEDEYEKIRSNSCEYEEFYYLENSKKNKKTAIFDARNFLTFDYNSHIYTLLMPSLQQYKKQFIEDDLEDNYLKEFQKFKRDSKIIKVSKYHNNIVEFWKYFEKAILKYKGVNNQSFIYFLKEFEFKYNHTKDEAKDLLIQYYFKD